MTLSPRPKASSIRVRTNLTTEPKLCSKMKLSQLLSLSILFATTLLAGCGGTAQSSSAPTGVRLRYMQLSPYPELLPARFTDGNGTETVRTAEQWGQLSEWGNEIPFKQSNVRIKLDGEADFTDFTPLERSQAPHGLATIAVGGTGIRSVRAWYPPSDGSRCSLQMIGFQTSSPPDSGAYEVFLRKPDLSEVKIGGFSEGRDPQMPIDFVPPAGEVTVVLRLYFTGEVYDVFGRMTLKPGMTYIGFTGKRANGDGTFRKISRILEDPFPSR